MNFKYLVYWHEARLLHAVLYLSAVLFMEIKHSNVNDVFDFGSHLFYSVCFKIEIIFEIYFTIQTTLYSENGYRPIKSM